MTSNERKESLLRIGKIPYANLFPIFYMLHKECDWSKYEFIEGVPSALNRLLRSGVIDISPSSSIEYLRCESQYALIEDHSISSKGPIGSILLLTKNPVEELGGKVIFVSSQSETSVALLDIILKKFCGIECSLMSSGESLDFLISKADAFLVIGDEALKAKKTVTNYELQIRGDKDSSLPHVYDLGDLWYRNTGLPFVFALWIARKDCLTEKAELLGIFIRDLHKAKDLALQNLEKIARELKPVLLSRQSVNITEEELISFWKGISYDLTAEQMRGLELFRKYSEELGLL